MKLRIAGAVVMILCVLVYEPQSVLWWQRLVVPIMMAVATAAIVKNVLAVAIAGSLLALIHGNLAAEDWITALAYPTLALLGTMLVLALLIRRFQKRIQATHQARWANRLDNDEQL